MVEADCPLCICANIIRGSRKTKVSKWGAIKCSLLPKWHPKKFGFGVWPPPPPLDRIHTFIFFFNDDLPYLLSFIQVLSDIFLLDNEILEHSKMQTAKSPGVLHFNWISNALRILYQTSWAEQGFPLWVTLSWIKFMFFILEIAVKKTLKFEFGRNLNIIPIFFLYFF